MSQDDMNVANSDGATVRADINSQLGAIVTSHSGATAPSTTFAFQLWADTANDLMKIRNAANSAWIIMFVLSTSGFEQGADIASGTALPVLADGVLNDVTGTTTVTSINTLGIGSFKILQFDAAVLLTHHSTDLVLPAGRNITTVAGQVISFYEYATGDWRLVSNSLPSVGKHTIFIPAAAMRPTTSNGAAAIADTETTAGRPDISGFAFDSSADEHVQFQVCMPKSWNLGTVTFQSFWSHNGGQTGGLDGVAFGLQGVAVSNDDTIDVAYGTAIVPTAVDGVTAEDMFQSAESTAITIAGTPADDDIIFFRLFRDVSADDLDVDANLIGIKLFITLDAQEDT